MIGRILWVWLFLWCFSNYIQIGQLEDRTRDLRDIDRAQLEVIAQWATTTNKMSDTVVLLRKERILERLLQQKTERDNSDGAAVPGVREASGTPTERRSL